MSETKFLESLEDEEEMVYHMHRVLQSLWGDDYTSDSSRQDTARRFVAFLEEFHSSDPQEGEHLPEKITKGIFNLESAGQDEQVDWVQQFGMPFRMICEHHLLPAWGHAHIAYKPNNAVLGLSKFPRLVDDVATSGATLQERFTKDLLRKVYSLVNPKALIVIIESEHSCVGCRGVNKPGIVTITDAYRGSVHESDVHRLKDLALTKGRH